MDTITRRCTMMQPFYCRRVHDEVQVTGDYEVVFEGDVIREIIMTSFSCGNNSMYPPECLKDIREDKVCRCALNCSEGRQWCEYIRSEQYKIDIGSVVYQQIDRSQV